MDAGNKLCLHHACVPTYLQRRGGWLKWGCWGQRARGTFFGAIGPGTRRVLSMGALLIVALCLLLWRGGWGRRGIHIRRVSCGFEILWILLSLRYLHFSRRLNLVVFG